MYIYIIKLVAGPFHLNTTPAPQAQANTVAPVFSSKTAHECRPCDHLWRKPNRSHLCCTEPSPAVDACNRLDLLVPNGSLIDVAR